ncbi:uncharacterized protein EV420DRAFT_1643992 [Desarmillaria tabescens]|uniref:F-box domain-containing protein n=1 Tax=Armillaria tabescens TaxID=1929756 RepID=A0AA39KC44_ARMTA|nr:uncharacterized protein EV420DRAFT_1643992 [Desarmillaria tabescens]KAK0457245.1 hypothetical protein EV420DRAFT_1643992 [Desarmillaria tabescens]
MDSTSHKKRRKISPRPKENVPPEGHDDVKEVKERRGSKRRLKGSLAALLDMPLDILFLIFALLDPLDLLHLARLSKAFRRVLMSKTSITVWRSAIKNVDGFPAAPIGMSEPAWVGILFVSTCQFCWTSTVRSPNILLMTRICSACLKTHTVGETELESSMQRGPGDMNIHSILQLIPTTWMKLGNDGLQKTCLRSDFDYVIQKLTSFQRKEERDIYIQERKALVAILSDHARLSSDWYDIQTLKRSRELENLKEERSQAIIQRLTELGYGKEIRNIQSPDTPLEKHFLVRQPRPLTEKVWNNIKPQLIQYLDRMKAHRMARKRQKVVQSRKETAIAILRKYKNSLPLLTVAPSVVDFLELDCVRQVTNQPSKISVDEASFDPIVKQLPEIFATFQGSVEQRVIEHSFGADSSLSDEEKVTQSRLACNAFYCQRCTIWARQLNKRKKKNYPEWVTPLFYPDNMLHRCLHLEFHSSYKPKDPVLVTDGYRVRRAWSTDELVVDEDFRKVIRDVILLVGKDPGETTAQDMDLALEDIQFKCDKCPPMLSEDVLPPTHRLLHFELYGWRTLVQHLFTQHYRETESLESYIQLIESWSEDWEMVDESADDGTSDSVSPHCVDLPLSLYYLFLPAFLTRISPFSHDVQHVEAFVDIFKPMLERPFAERAARTTELMGIFPEGHPLKSADRIDDL